MHAVFHAVLAGGLRVVNGLAVEDKKGRVNLKECVNRDGSEVHPTLSLSRHYLPPHSPPSTLPLGYLLNKGNGVCPFP